MKIIIAGGTGFIGKPLAKTLAKQGNEVVVLSRNPEKAKQIFSKDISCLRWDELNINPWQTKFESADAIINLIGENVGQGRWTKKIKNRILSSRLIAGQAITKAFQESKNGPKVLVQSSATGYYGNENNKQLFENEKAGQGFLVDVCKQWEASTAELDSKGIRRVVIRTGLVLGKEGGVLKKMILPFRFFVGGPIGSGSQILPWIHIEDQINAIKFLIENNNLKGTFNLSSPNPVNMNVFSKRLGKTLKRPSWAKVPGFALRLLLGEMAQETVLSGQKTIPKALLEAGFTFQYPKLSEALKSIIQ